MFRPGDPTRHYPQPIEWNGLLSKFSDNPDGPEWIGIVQDIERDQLVALIERATIQLLQRLGNEVIDFRDIRAEVYCIIRISLVGDIMLDDITSPLYLLLSKLVNFIDISFSFDGNEEQEYLRMMDEASRLVSSEDDIDEGLRTLRNELIYASRFSFDYPEDSAEEGRDEITPPNTEGFRPDNWFYIPGEEYHYNKTNPLFEAETEILSRYNVYTDEYWRPHFKSCGLYATKDYEDGGLRADFTPLGFTGPGIPNRDAALVMGYRGMINLLHAIDKGEMGDDEFETITAYGTNLTMARMATKLGFKVIIEGQPYTKLPKGKFPLQESYDLRADITDIRTALEKLYDPKLHQRLTNSFVASQ